MNSIAFSAYTDRFNFLRHHLSLRPEEVFSYRNQKPEPAPDARAECERPPDRDRQLDGEVHARIRNVVTPRRGWGARTGA